MREPKGSPIPPPFHLREPKGSPHTPSVPRYAFGMGLVGLRGERSEPIQIVI